MNHITIFENPEFGMVRTMTDDNGEPLFCALDICSTLGYTNSRDALHKHVDEDDVAKRDTIDTMGRIQTISYINESGLYSLIFSSKIDSARRFKRWLTTEVLPQIRKTGGYIPLQDDDDEKTILAKALLIYKRTIDQQAQLLEEQAPQVEFSTAVMRSTNSILIGNLAKLISQNGVNIGQNRLFSWLRNNGYIGKSGRHLNIATQRSIDRGLFELEEKTVQVGNKSFVSVTTLVTGLGQHYFLNGFLSGRFHPE